MKGYSIHVGVGYVDEESYGEPLKLMGARQDAFSMHQIVQKTGLFEQEDSVSIVNDFATSDNFFRLLRKIICKTKENVEGAYVVLTYSGHGASKKFKDNTDTSDFFCFHDRMVLEHEFMNLLYEFPEHVKLFVIIDSCYSEGFVMHSHIKERATRRIKALNSEEIGSIFNDEKRYAFYEKMVQETEHLHVPLKAEACFLFACAKDHVTYDADNQGENSFFTDVLISQWANGQFDKTYSDFHALITQIITHNRGPKIHGDDIFYFKTNTPFIF